METENQKEQIQPTPEFKSMNLSRSTPAPFGNRLTYGQQVQSRFKTAPTPIFGSSQRPPLGGEGCVVRTIGGREGDRHREDKVAQRDADRQTDRERGVTIGIKPFFQSRTQVDDSFPCSNCGDAPCPRFLVASYSLTHFPPAYPTSFARRPLCFSFISRKEPRANDGGG